MGHRDGSAVSGRGGTGRYCEGCSHLPCLGAHPPVSQIHHSENTKNTRTHTTGETAPNREVMDCGFRIEVNSARGSASAVAMGRVKMLQRPDVRAVF